MTADDGKALAQARESDEMEGSIPLAGRRRSPGWDLIALGQVAALCC
jgi:hypothetical protein